MINLTNLIKVSFIGISTCSLAYAAEQPDNSSPHTRAHQKEEGNPELFNPFLNATGIAMKKFKSDELEGGYVIRFGTDNHPYDDDRTFSLPAISAAMNKGSLDAHLMMGLRMELQSGTLTYPIIQHYLAAASGDNGTSHQGNGGTSSGLAFYNLIRVERILDDSEELKQKIDSSLIESVKTISHREFKNLLNVTAYQKQIEELMATLKKRLTRK